MAGKTKNGKKRSNQSRDERIGQDEKGIDTITTPEDTSTPEAFDIPETLDDQPTNLPQSPQKKPVAQSPSGQRNLDTNQIASPSKGPASAVGQSTNTLSTNGKGVRTIIPAPSSPPTGAPASSSSVGGLFACCLGRGK